MAGKYKEGTKGILLRVQEAEKARIDAAAARAGMTTSDLIRLAVAAYVDLLEKLQAAKSSD